MNKHILFPIFLSISGKPCFIVGGGPVAYRKACDLLDAGADITVIAANPSQEIVELSESWRIRLKTKRFEPNDIKEAFLVFAATDDSSVNALIAETAERNGALINVVDTPELCGFFSGAVVKRGPLKIAISTGGCSPGTARQIRMELEDLYPESYCDFIEAAGEMRHYILSQENISPGEKKSALSWLSRKETRKLFFEDGKERMWEELKKLIK